VAEPSGSELRPREGEVRAIFLLFKAVVEDETSLLPCTISMTRFVSRTLRERVDLDETTRSFDSPEMAQRLFSSRYEIYPTRRISIHVYKPKNEKSAWEHCKEVWEGGGGAGAAFAPWATLLDALADFPCMTEYARPGPHFAHQLTSATETFPTASRSGGATELPVVADIVPENWMNGGPKSTLSLCLTALQPTDLGVTQPGLSTSAPEDLGLGPRWLGETVLWVLHRQQQRRTCPVFRNLITRQQLCFLEHRELGSWGRRGATGSARRLEMIKDNDEGPLNSAGHG